MKIHKGRDIEEDKRCGKRRTQWEREWSSVKRERVGEKQEIWGERQGERERERVKGWGGN